MGAEIVRKNWEGILALLGGKSKDLQNWVYNYLDNMGSTVEDPWYLQLANSAYVAYVLKNAPDEMRLTLEECQKQLFDSLEKGLESFENAKAAAVESRITRMAERLLEEKLEKKRKDSPSESSKSQEPSSSKPSIPFQFNCKSWVAAVALLAVGMGGFFSGYAVRRPENGLTKDRMALLQWAESPKGKFAKNLIEWNGDRLTSRSCVSEASIGEITLSIEGIQATTGVCAVFVTDPRDTKPEAIRGGS